MVLEGVGWCWMVLDGVGWCWKVLDGIRWCWKVLEGVGRCWMVLDGENVSQFEIEVDEVSVLCVMAVPGRGVWLCNYCCGSARNCLLVLGE